MWRNREEMFRLVEEELNREENQALSAKEMVEKFVRFQNNLKIGVEN